MATKGAYRILLIACIVLIVLAGMSYTKSSTSDESIDTHENGLIIDGNTEGVTITEVPVDDTELQEQQENTVNEGLAGIDEMLEVYTNIGLGVQFAYPADWVLDTQSQTGVFTVRAVKNLGPVAYAAYDILLHNVEIHVEDDQDLKTVVNDRDAYVINYDACIVTQSISCVLNVVRIPIEEGTHDMSTGKDIWTVKALEIRYGVYHDIDKKDLAEAGITDKSGRAVNNYLGLYDLFTQQEQTFERMINKTFYLK